MNEGTSERARRRLNHSSTKEKPLVRTIRKKRKIKNQPVTKIHKIKKKKTINKKEKPLSLFKYKEKPGQLQGVLVSPGQIDFSLLFVIMMLVMFGVIMVFSSSYYAALTKVQINDMYYFFKRQLLWSVIGFAAMIFMANFDYKLLRRFAFPMYIISCVMLVLVLFIGTETNGSKRWLFGIQPSEVCKIALIILMAHIVTDNRRMLKTFRGFLKMFVFVAIPIVLIAVENLSTAIVVTAIGVSILFVASPKIWYFIAMIAPIVGGGFVAIVGFPQFAYRLGRIKAWLDPFSDPTNLGFQTVQSLYAVASGGLFGLGLGQSRQKLGYIPEAYNDIIFSIVCEELGFVGAAAVLALFMVLIYKGIKIALGTQELFGSLVATGIICMIGIQVLINIAVITNTIPVTGMPLPFISYGGSSLVLVMASMGILLNISRYARN